MPRGMLAGIIFGCRTSETDKRMVREWVELAASPPGFTKQFKGMVPSRWTLKKSTETRANKRMQPTGNRPVGLF